MLNKIIDEVRNIFRSIAQRFNIDLDGAESVIQVFSKFTSLHVNFKFMIGGRNNPGIGTDCFFGAQRGKITPL